jgi:mannose-6-phosphate isomerase-like protein (cupin superfamily)
LGEITPEEVLKNHGVRCFHTRNKGTGELRFRLLSERDGTAYIRTVSGPAGAWQQSHYHSKARETYIVQSGWIGYAELGPSGPRYLVYSEGQMFTVPPETIHNIYMPRDAVIHTIKHGKAVGEERLVDNRTKEFDQVTARVTEQELLRLGTKPPEAPEPSAGTFPQKYNEAYRHFDNLIWQVPAWTTAILAVVFAGATQITATSPLVELLRLEASHLVAVVSALFALFMFAVSHALYRFRWHQTQVKWHTPQHPLRSPQVFLQLLVNLQGAALLAVAALAVDQLPRGAVLGVLLVIVAAISFRQERNLIIKGRAEGKPESSES